MIDTHIHLDLLPDPGAHMQAAVDVGVVGMLAVGVDPRVSARPIVAVPAGLEIRLAIGLHPQELPRASAADVDEAFDVLEERLRHEGDIAAIGECGFDARPGIGAPALKDRSTSTSGPRPSQSPAQSQPASSTMLGTAEALERQLQVFRRHLAVARRHGLPLILHAVRRDGATLAALDEDIARHGPLPPVLWHAFSASRETLALAIARGVHVAVGGLVRPIPVGSTTQTGTKGRRLLEAVAHIPTSSLLVETDAPPLDPAALPEVIRALASLRGVSPGALAEATTTNARRLLGFGA